jgi:hypothetical protein
MKATPLKLGSQTGSFMNHLMSHNSIPPVVGKGGTLLSWTDRDAFEVLEVTNGGKRVKFRMYQPTRIDNNGMSECQEYEFTKLRDFDEYMVFRNGSWRREIVKVVFTDTFYNEVIEPMGKDWYGSELNAELWNEEGDLQVVEGCTRVKYEYPKLSVLFGSKDHYYDFSF